MIAVKNVSKSFRDKTGKIKVLDNINFKVKDGEFVTVFGPNGCGKTTLLYIIAGLLKSDNGRTHTNNKEKPKISFIFQDYSDSLLPWKTVRENIGFVSKTPDEWLDKFDLNSIKNKYPYHLSGGQKQLTCIARAFAYNPDIFLLDEPFSSLDYDIAKKMELELLKIWRQNKKTTIFVSHDLDEAIFLADKVIVLSDKPSKIKGIISVKLNRPRSLNLLESKEFFEIRKNVLELFRK